MIVTQTKREIITEGLGEGKQMRIVQNEEVEAHIVKTLTENYKFAKESSIREAISNHYDSHVENGNPEQPIIIKFYKDEIGNYIYESSDQGLGLSIEEFDLYYMGIGMSSKRGKAELLGAKGLGAKAFLSVVDSYNVITRKNGIEWSFLIYKGEKFPDRSILYEKETTEPNGVTIKVNISRWDKTEFINAIKEQTCYFKTCYYQIEGETELNNAKVFENDLFTFSEIYPNSEMHISFGPCHYPIEWKLLGMNPLYVPVGLKIPIDSGIDVHFNRESLVYDTTCKNIIKDKIKQVTEWFVNKYNEDTKEYNNLKEAWNNINTFKHYVKIHDTNFEITDLEKYSDIKFNNIKVKDIDYIPLSKFRSNYDYIVKQWKIVGEVKWNGKFSEKNATSYKDYFLEKKTVLINDNVSITGWFKEWLKKSKYQIFVKYDYYAKKEDLKFYKQLLELEKYPKQDWRKVIQEWQRVKKEFVSTLFTDGTNFHNSQDFIDFRNENKSNKKYQSLSSYNRLNKQKGDITIHVPIPKYHNCNEYKLEKQVFKIEKLHQQKYKFVILTEEQKEECKKLARYFTNFNNYKFVVVTKGEIKKLPTIKNIIMFAKIEKRPSDLKLFSKIASAALYSQELEKFNKITYNIDGTILQSFSNNLSENIKKLESFTKLYSGNYGDAEAIIQKAIETNDFDLTNDAEYQQLKQFNDKFSFVQFLKCDRWNKSEFIKELNTQLLMRRLYKPETYSEFEICVVEKKQEETTILEQEVA